MKQVATLILISISFFGCRERYEITIPESSKSVLVVEGIISNGGQTIIRLSRTSDIATRMILPENNAVVQVQGEDNSVFPLILLNSRMIWIQ